jgi:hypothetical protein
VDAFGQPVDQCELGKGQRLLPNEGMEGPRRLNKDLIALEIDLNSENTPRHAAVQFRLSGGRSQTVVVETPVASGGEARGAQRLGSPISNF